LEGDWKLAASTSRLFAVNKNRLLTSDDGEVWLPFNGDFTSRVYPFNEDRQCLLAVDDLLYVLPQTNEALLICDAKAHTVQRFPTPWKWRSMTSAALLGSTLYVSGGFDGDRAVPELWAFDGTWSQLPSMAVGRYEHTMTTVNSRLIVVGGASGVGAQALDSVEMFVPAQNAWLPCPSLAQKRTEHAAVADGTRLVVAGGVDHRRVGQSGSDTLVEEVEALDLGSAAGWQTVALLPLQSAFHRVELV
jgi:hypothetical protein